MSRINPIYIIAVLIFTFFILMYNLHSVNMELAEAKISYKETSQIASQIGGLSKVYSSNKQELNKSLDRVLKQASLKTANIKKKIGATSITLSSESMNKTAINSLMGKLLNGTYNIHTLNIKRLSDEQASLELEVKW